MVSLDCCNKLPQTWRLKTAEIYCLTVLEPRGPKSRCQQGCAPAKALGENSSVASSSFWWLQALAGLYLHYSNLCLDFPWTHSSVFPSSICVKSPVFLSEGHLSLDSGPTLIIHNLISRFLTFSRKGHIDRCQGEDMKMSFWEAPLNLLQ